MSAVWNEFQTPRPTTNPTVRKPGQVSGSTTRVNTPISLAPSTRAASSKSRGICTMKARSRNVAKGALNATYRIVRP